MTALELAQVRALAVSSDGSLAADPRDAAGDTLSRQRAYAQLVARYDIVVRAPGESRPVAWAPSPTLRIRAVPASRWGFVISGYRAALATCLLAGTQIVTCQDPISMGLIGYLLKRRLGVALNLQINGDIVDNPYWLAENRLYPAFNVLARWLIRRADTIRVSTSGERGKYVDGWGISQQRVWNVPFMVDFGPFLNADASGVRERLHVPHGAPLVLFLGRLVKAKDLGVLLKAVPRILAGQPRVKVVIAGAGPEETSLRRLAHDLGIEASVRFPGRIAHQDVPGLFAAADVFVLCSHYEGTSMVTLEAAASGLPIVSTDVTGAVDAILPGQSGLLVPKRHPKALADAIACLLDDPQRAQEMGARGRAHVIDRFEPQRIARRMAELWLATIRLSR